MQRTLAGAVAELRPRLARVGAAVVLEVELSDDRRQLVGALLHRIEEALARGEFDQRQPAQVRDPLRPLEDLGVGPPPPLPKSTRLASLRSWSRNSDTARRSSCGSSSALYVPTGEVGDHLRPVDAAPAEGVVRWAGELVPRELLGDEARDPELAEDLRQLPVVAERIGAPVDRAAPAEVVLEPPLPAEQLADERLAARQVAVGLDPGAADHLPAALGDPLGERAKSAGSSSLEPGVMLGRGGRVTVLRVAVH